MPEYRFTELFVRTAVIAARTCRGVFSQNGFVQVATHCIYEVLPDEYPVLDGYPPKSDKTTQVLARIYVHFDGGPGYLFNSRVPV